MVSGLTGIGGTLLIDFISNSLLLLSNGVVGSRFFCVLISEKPLIAGDDSGGNIRVGGSRRPSFSFNNCFWLRTEEEIDKSLGWDPKKQIYL